MTTLVLHLMEVAKTSRMKQGSSFSIVDVRKAIKEEIAMISTNAVMYIFVKTVERV